MPKFDHATTRLNNVERNPRFAVGSPDEASVGSPSLNPDSPIDIESPSERPPGRKGEKDRQKRKNRVSSLSTNKAVVERVEKFHTEYFEKANDTRDARLHFNNQMSELIKIRKEEKDLKLQKQEDAIMSVDTTNMSIPQQQYYQIRFNEIMARKQADANSESSSGNM